MSNSANLKKMLAAVKWASQQFKTRSTEGSSLFGRVNQKEGAQPGPDARLKMIDDFTRARESFSAISKKLKAASQNAAALSAEAQQSGPPLRTQASRLKRAYQNVDRLQQQRDTAQDTLKMHRAALQKGGIGLSGLDNTKADLQDQSTQLKAKKQEQWQNRAEKLSAFGDGSLKFAKTGFNIGKKILTTGYEQSLKQNGAAAAPDKQNPVAMILNVAQPGAQQLPAPAAGDNGSVGGDLQVIQSSRQKLNGTNVFNERAPGETGGNLPDAQNGKESSIKTLQYSYQTLGGAEILRPRDRNDGKSPSPSDGSNTQGSSKSSALQIIQSCTQVVNSPLSTGKDDDSAAKIAPSKELTHSAAAEELKGPASLQSNNLSTDLQALESAWQGFSLDVYSQHESSLRSLAQTATSYISQVRQWMQNNEELARTFGLIASGAIGVAGTAGSIAVTVAPFIANLNTLVTIATTVGSVLSTVFGGIMTVIGTLSLPIIGVIAAFAAAALAVYTFWEPISAFFGGVIDGIKIAFAPVAELFTPFKPVFDGIGKAITYIKDLFNDLISPINFSKDTLESCANAGKLFGKALADALMFPIKTLNTLKEGIDWVLEKLNIIDKNKSSVNNQKDTPISTGAVAALGVVNNLNNYQAAKPAAGHIYTDNSQTAYNITLNGDVSPGSDNRQYFEDLFSNKEASKKSNTLSQFSPTGGLPA